MKRKLSIKNNQELLSKRLKTTLKSGVKISKEQENQIISEAKSSLGFIGVIPLRCQLGEYYFLSLDDDGVADYIFWFGCFGYERSSAVLFTHLAKEANHVLDLGSYSGYYSVLSSVLAKNSHTYAVEANPLNFHRLTENSAINGANIVSCNYALVPASEQSQETITILYNAKLRVLDTGSFAAHELAEIISQKNNKQHQFIVPAITFTSLIKELAVQEINDNYSYALIKLDIEGLEVSVLTDIVAYYADKNYIVFVEILTATSYQAIYALTAASDGLSMAYINEYTQKVMPHNQPNYARQLGSRNFLFGSQELIGNICTLSINALLMNYE